jgi:hypothetical protein
MGVDKTDELPHSFDPPPAPEPAAQWQELLNEWKEWPSLISMTLHDLAAKRDNLLRLHPGGQFRGLSPLIGSGLLVMVGNRDVSRRKMAPSSKKHGIVSSMSYGTRGKSSAAAWNAARLASPFGLIR